MSQNSTLIGEKLGSYRIESVLGSGAMGVVYRGTDEKRARPAAIKVVSGEIARGGKVQRRFEREAEILQQFRHPGIVRFLAWGKFRGTWYIAMEFIQGRTLEKILQERGAMPWREVLDLGIQVCEALSYAHERGVVHRDLKPSNLMVTAEGKVKLTDFGIAKDLDKTALTATGRTLGTAAYMSPEQIRGTPAVSHKTDLYALGVLLYQMLAGKPPFEGNSPVVLMHCHMNEPPPRPSAKVVEIPRALDDLVVALMAKAPADRPWDATAVMMVLTELRDKAERGQAIGMVWPGAGSAAAGARSQSAATDRPRRKTRKIGTLATFTATVFGARSRAAGAQSESEGLSPAALETTLLALALLAIGSFIVYWVWPPGQDYLYHHAEALMKSDKRHDWITARDEYLEPLDRRFPDNPYHEQTQKWRDQILLKEADGRAEILTAPVKTHLSDPKTDAERQYVVHHAVAADASDRGDDRAAVRQWQELALRLKPQSDDPSSEDPEERKWYLLALHRADQLQNAIRDRRQFVLKQMQLAEEAFRSGHFDQAGAIRKKLIDQYQKYTDLADLFPAPAPAAPGPQPAAPTPPGPPPPSPSPPAQPGAAAPADAQPAPSPSSKPKPQNPPSTQPSAKNERPDGAG